MQLYAVNTAKTVIVSSRVNLFSASPCNADINLPEHTLLFRVKTFTVLKHKLVSHTWLLSNSRTELPLDEDLSLR